MRHLCMLMMFWWQLQAMSDVVEAYVKVEDEV